MLKHSGILDYDIKFKPKNQEDRMKISDETSLRKSIQNITKQSYPFYQPK